MDKEDMIDTFRTIPFPTITGNEDAKDALLVGLVSDRVRTILIEGPTGTGKTTLVRSLGSITDRSIINIPVGTRDDQIFGTLDMEKTIKEGKCQSSVGILEKSDNNIIYVDDINLMDDSLSNQLIESVICGRGSVIGGGLDREYPCRTVLVATFNSSESNINPHILDKFDICVSLRSEDERMDILRNRLDFDRDPETFSGAFSKECAKISDRVGRARERIQYVSVPDDIIEIIAQLCIRTSVEGHRGDVAMVNVSMALAALDERDVVTVDDVKTAAKLCLRHRVNEIPEEEESRPNNDGDGSQSESPPPMNADRSEGCSEKREGAESGKAMDDIVFDIGESFSVIDFTTLRNFGHASSSKTSGKHQKATLSGKRGRYIRSEIPKSKVTDLAFDATIRAAAPYQRHRHSDDVALVLEKTDIRQKIREGKKGISVLFVVDASGSMGAVKRMVAVKGAVFSLLQESYRNRDKVGLIAFRKDRAEVLLPYTKSVDFAYKKLKEMPTGGTTPLAAALLKTHMELQKEMRLNPGEKCYVVLATDGRANASLSDGDAWGDAERIATMIGKSSKSEWIVVDTGTGYPHLDNAVRICKKLNGIYLRLDELKGNRLSGRIKSLVNSRRFA